MTEAHHLPRYVIDTSVALKWFVESDEGDLLQARQLREAFLQGRCILRAPELLPVELANALKLGRKFSPSEVVEALESVRNMGSLLEAFSWSALEKAVEISAVCDVTVYDSYFLAVALGSGSILVTADEVFARKVRRYPGIVSLRRLRLPD